MLYLQKQVKLTKILSENPRSGIHSAIMGYLKWRPMRKWARENPGVCFVSGRRKKESKRRMRLQKYIDKPEKNMLFCSPLFYWNTSQVWNYIKSNVLEICPVYQTLHISGDCLRLQKRGKLS